MDFINLLLEKSKDSKYLRWYINLIMSRKDTTEIHTYHEKHHILPKSIYPEFSDLKQYPDNGIDLSAKEHFIAHLLLAKMFFGNDRKKMCYAFLALKNQKNRFQENRISSSRRYQSIRDTVHKDDWRKGKTLEEIHGKEKAVIIRNKLKLRRSRGKLSEEERKKASERMIILHKTSPWKRNFQNQRMPKEKCLSCGKEIDIGNLKKYHSDGSCGNRYFLSNTDGRRYHGTRSSFVETFSIKYDGERALFLHNKQHKGWQVILS